MRAQGSSAVVTRSRSCAFDSTAAISSTLVSDDTGKEIYGVVPAGDCESVYIAGAFIKVNFARESRGWPPEGHHRAHRERVQGVGVSNQVTALDLVGNEFYLSVAFTRVGGVPRTLLNALDATTGADTGSFGVTCSHSSAT